MLATKVSHSGTAAVRFVAVKIVAHEEPAAQQILAHLFRVLVAQLPVPHLNAVKRGPIVHFVAAIQRHHLFYRSCVDASEPADTGQ